jgi:hypothetical protein
MEFSDEDRPQELIIRIISPPHCARGSKRCEQCAEAAKTQIPCLIRVFFDVGIAARPVMELEIDGQMQSCEFDVIKKFNSTEDAMKYAKENDITSIGL